MKQYDISQWYWFVAGDRDYVWSSSFAKRLQVEHPDVRSFIADGNSPSMIGSMDELIELFAAQYPAGHLLTYANAVQWQKATGGYSVDVNGQSIVIPTTPESMALIGGKAQRLKEANPPSSINWQVGLSTIVEIEAERFAEIAVAIADFVQGTFDTLKFVFAGIDDGTIDTRAKIDAAFR